MLMQRVLAWAIIILAVLSLTLVFERMSLASFKGGPAYINRKISASSPGRCEREIGRIISVLENRIGAGMPVKAKDKLLIMDDKELLLAGSLCDRIAAADNKEGADFALLLVAALIIST